jgi:hypothetical protein
MLSRVVEQATDRHVRKQRAGKQRHACLTIAREADASKMQGRWRFAEDCTRGDRVLVIVSHGREAGSALKRQARHTPLLSHNLICDRLALENCTC